MLHAHCMKAVMGGLSLILMLSACSSGSKSRKADMQARTTSSDVVTDRGSYDPTDRMTTSPDQMAATERPVPSDRLGSGDSRASGSTTDRMTGEGRAEDRIVPCADAQGDITASMDCDRMNRDRTDLTGLSDRSPEIAAACPSRPPTPAAEAGLPV